jgi:hypothetical protein
MSEGFRLWWFEMEPRILRLGIAVVGLALAYVITRLVFQEPR